jgi:hypothetical protein
LLGLCGVKKKYFNFSQFYRSNVGLSDGAIPFDNTPIGEYENSFAITTGTGGNAYEVWIAGWECQFDLQVGDIEPNFKYYGTNVYGCGLVLDPEDDLCVFFTVNGTVVGEFALEILRINKKEWMFVYISN